MAASSSSISRYCQPSTSSSVPPHDIFLSHSSAQKPFVTALYERLRTRYTTFLDITDHSLPLGEDFTRHIFHAIDTCQMAVIVLSEEYLQSKWPMVELCAFFEATPQPKIVPLFFKLAPGDLKNELNKEKWRKVWEGFAKKDSRIEVANWELALRQLAKYNGIQIKQCEEEDVYIARVFTRICGNMRPSMSYNVSDFPGIHRMSQAVLAKFEELDKDESKVCVLMIYGPPGSGKSTLCMHLHDNQSTKFCGRVFYLDLPTYADAEQVLVKFKELLKQLTNFNNKVDLSDVSHLSQVHYLLKGTDFSATKLFLLVDNVSSQESHDFLKELLRLDLAVGSKVLIMSRSISFLGSHLRKDYVYGCMCVPDLHKEEALQILLQSGGGMDLADAYVLEASMTPSHHQIIPITEEIVDICSTKGRHLPLVLKIVGNYLSELDVHNWNETMKKIVSLHKKDAVKQILKENFRKLSKNLQTLFLDLALFIVPLVYLGHGFNRMGEDFLCPLRLMHGWKQEELELKMKKLQKRGFLTIWKVRERHSGVLVHDLYLEFAASIKEACNYFWSGLTRSNAKWNETMGKARTIALRTVVLELDETHKEYEFGQEHASVKAVILRNCQSLKVLRGMKNLTSLVSLQIYSCPNLMKVQRFAAGWNLQMFEWSNQKGKGCTTEMLQPQALEAKSMTKKQHWNPIWELFSRKGLGRRSLMGIDELLIQMKKLEVLRLVNTGIRKSVDLSGCLPQLRVVQVLEPNMKRFRACDLPNLEELMVYGVRYMDRLYEKLDRSLINRLGRIGTGVSKDWLYLSSAARQYGLRTITFAGCPKLQVVHMRGASLGNELQVIPIASSSSQMKVLVLDGTWIGSSLPDFMTVAESLDVLLFKNVPDFRELNFTCMYKNLRQLLLSRCPSVVQVTGLDGLSVLETLSIWECQSLKTLRGLGGLVGLRIFVLGVCPNTQLQCLMHDLESLTKLEKVQVDVSGAVMNEAFNVRELANLKWLCLNGIKSTSSTGMLIGSEYVTCLDELELSGEAEPWGETSREAELWGEMSSVLLMDLATLLGGLSQLSFLLMRSLRLEHLRNLTSLNGLGYLGSLEYLSLKELPNLTSLSGVEYLGSLKALTLQHLPLQNLTSLNGVKGPGSLRNLRVWWMPNLTSLSGVEYLGSLKRLWLKGLDKLTCLQGIEALTKLKVLELRDCLSVEEVPSLSALIQLGSLSCSDCKKLRSLKGWEALPELMSFTCKGCDSLECGSFAATLHARNPSAFYNDFDGLMAFPLIGLPKVGLPNV